MSLSSSPSSPVAALSAASAGLARQIDAVADVIDTVATDDVQAALARLGDSAMKCQARLRNAANSLEQIAAVVLRAVETLAQAIGDDVARASLPVAPATVATSPAPSPSPAPSTPAPVPAAEPAEESPALARLRAELPGFVEAPEPIRAEPLAALNGSAASKPNPRKGGRK